MDGDRATVRFRYNRTNSPRILGTGDQMYILDGPGRVRRLNDGLVIPIDAMGGWLWKNDGQALEIGFYEFC